MMNKNVLNYGLIDDLPQKKILKAGKLSMIYQNGFIRYINYGDCEIIRMINHAVRDANWDTLPFKIENETIMEREDSFQISYDAVIHSKGVEFTWKCAIEGRSDCQVIFEIKGVAKSDFKKNRTGFTVLHPLKECVGKPIEIIEPDGSKLTGLFPILIAPHQPFKDIQSMNWRPHDSIKAQLILEGDVFEMEDQRNWMDASYKTYCTPLDLPFPVRLEKGEEVVQKVALKVDAETNQTQSAGNGDVQITISDNKSKLPMVGLCESNEVEQMTGAQLKLVERLRLDIYRVDVRLSDPEWQDSLIRSCKEAQAMQCLIELCIFTNQQLSDMSSIELSPEIVEQIGLVTLYADDEKTITDARISVLIEQARKIFSKAKIGAGTDAFFAELNRERIQSNYIDFLSFSTNPQVHASDIDSWVETLEAIPSQINSCADFADGKAIHISPLTFKMRWNPNATGENPIDPADTIPWNADRRQMSRFGAIWTLGALKQFAESGIDSITLFETVGMKGLIPNAATSLKPFKMVSPYPLYHLLENILAQKHFPILVSSSNQPHKCEALCFDKKDHIHILLGNYTGEYLKVNLPDGQELLRVQNVLGGPAEETFSRDQYLGPYQILSIKVSKSL